MIGTSRLRISGMMSGLDTDSLVKDLMKAERIPFDKLKQQRERLLWKSEKYREWNTEIYSFRSTVLFDMKLSKSYGTFNVASGDSNKATGVATADAIEGTHNLIITDLAAAAAFKGTTKIDNTKALNAQDTTATPPYRNLNSDASITVSVTDSEGVTRTATVTIKAGDNINAAASAFNLAKDASGESLGLHAYFDNSLQQFILKTKETGEQTAITLTAAAGSEKAFYTLGFTTDANNTNTTFTTAKAPATPDPNTVYQDSAGSVATSGKNANITFNGTNITTLTSNSVNLLGVNYTLKDKTTAAGINMIVTRDLDKEIENIKNFVTKYNELLDKINKAVNEQVYKDYQPLTDEQREELSEKQIEQWEAKAKSGLMRRDSILTELKNNMRLHATSSVDNGSDYNSLSAIGIKSSSYLDNGKLTIDEDKLREALQNDPEAVKNLFTQNPDNPGPGDRGIIQLLYDDFEEAFGNLTEKAGITGNKPGDESVVGKLLQGLDKRIDRFEDRLLDKENYYYSKFTALEKAISRYNAQSGWLTQQFGGGA